ncbi:MAG: hypothetical protein L3V56_09155 [Candidatus Magnetoovum sp. WYHC-5]|nr:hypothetical protein [Candidatus Magnetoovum sp. WYHC-5]
MDIFFNELSFKIADDITTAKEWMNTLIDVYRLATKKGIEGFRIKKNFLEQYIYAGYMIRQWLNDKTVNREKRLLFKTKINKSPYIDGMLSANSSDKDEVCEFFHNGQKADGLEITYIFDSIAISFCNDNMWNTHMVNVYKNCLKGDNQYIDKTDEKIRHISKSDHLLHHESWIKDKIKDKISNGRKLWSNRESLFPHLYFCDSIQSQINNLSINQPEFKQIKKSLFEFEAYCSNRIPMLHFTIESETRLKQLKVDLTFLCPDGKERLFSLHFRYTPGAGRIYVYPTDKEDKVDNEKYYFVGYIGKKIQ